VNKVVIDLSRARLTPYEHQLKGTNAIVMWDDTEVGRIIGGVFYLADEMGAGKTKQVIDALQVLCEWGLIKLAVIVCPGAVRGVWFDPEYGELAKHLWANFPVRVTEYHGTSRTWEWFTTVDGKKVAPQLEFIITNYEFIRSPDRLKLLKARCNDETMLVLDESSAVKNWQAKQTKACEELRSACARVVELNGTPISNSPGDMYSQANILDPKILQCKTYYHFRARYGVMGGWQGRQIIDWQNIEDLQKRMAPYTLRRLKEQCLDLPPKLDSVIMPVALTPKTWKVYKEMRDEMVAWLTGDSVTTASQAIVKAIRLAQITSGFVGGVEVEEPAEMEEFDRPDFIDHVDLFTEPAATAPHDPRLKTVEVGREKLEAFMAWFEGLIYEDPKIKLLVWCRFVPEVDRLFEELVKFDKVHRGKIYGKQKRDERARSVQLLDPRATPDAPVVVIGTPATGSMGLNLTAAHTVLYMSNDFSYKTRKQSEDRVHRPGQIHPVSYFDMIATGPNGQKTIDHTVIKALLNKQGLADMTTSAWLDILSD
jgi:SNF2 family DNA or RNA helicase